jgi:hypothetical protein
MERKDILGSILILFGTLLAASLLEFNWTFNLASADTNLHFEIFDCPVQGNSTYEKSGKCPDMRSMTSVDNSFGKEESDSRLPIASGPVNPFGP